MNRTVEIALRYMIIDASNGRPVSEWDKLLPDIEYALNTAFNISTGYSLFLLLYGIYSRLEIDLFFAPI
jgi:hypothetical protein